VRLLNCFISGIYEIFLSQNLKLIKTYGFLTSERLLIFAPIMILFVALYFPLPEEQELMHLLGGWFNI